VKVVLASDKFKGSLSADQVADALTRGLLSADPRIAVDRVPVADGGDGTLDAALSAGFERCSVMVEGPTGEPVKSAFARRDSTAVVELADASGLGRLSAGLAPLRATTVGTGQLIAAAIGAGCSDIMLGVGGSSSTDGGAGVVTGLGGRVLDAAGRPVAPGGGGLAEAASVDLAGIRELLSGVRIVLACDVDNPLTGPDGAAAVYGPQKGASAADVAALDDALRHWADLIAAAVGADVRDRPGAGAAGGAGFAALAILGAEMRSGVDTVLDLVGFDEAVAGADIVVTGEGSLDEQSLRGKAPVGVLRRASRLGVPVVAVCGRTTLDEATQRHAGLLQVWSLAERQPDPGRSMVEAADLLEEVGAEMVGSLSAHLTSSPPG
jgi:glycerate 2-kinase